MKQVTIHAAKTNLSKLIEAALGGEDIIIAKGNKPVIRLVPVGNQTFQIGPLANQLGTAPDFLEPMAPDDLALWEGE